MDRSYGQDGVAGVDLCSPHSARCRSGDPGVEHLSCDASKGPRTPQVGQHVSGLRRCPGHPRASGVFAVRRARYRVRRAHLIRALPREDRDLYHSALPISQGSRMHSGRGQIGVISIGASSAQRVVGLTSHNEVERLSGLRPVGSQVTGIGHRRDDSRQPLRAVEQPVPCGL
jgi:hypothetical protein